MATFRKRGKRWQAIIRKSGQKPVVKTFPNKLQAETWARGVETDMDRQAWRRIVKAAPDGVLMDSDEIMLDMAACLLAQFQRDPDGMTTARITRLEVQLGKFGLSPSDRARIGVSPDDNDEF